MRLNCRPGDLAVIVRSEAGNEGKIVRCVRLIDDVEAMMSGWICRDFLHGPVWLLENAITHTFGVLRPICADAKLRPLRDDEGEDEMLRIAGRPQERERV